jgi:hypothetical protein
MLFPLSARPAVFNLRSQETPNRKNGQCRRRRARRRYGNQLAAPLERIDLAPGGGKGGFDRGLGMFVAAIVRRQAIDHDILVRRHCNPEVDRKAGAVTVFVARRDDGDAAADDAMVVLLQKRRFAFDHGAHIVGRIESFKSYLQRNLHDYPSPSPKTLYWIFVVAAYFFSALFAGRKVLRPGDRFTKPRYRKAMVIPATPSET